MIEKFRIHDRENEQEWERKRECCVRLIIFVFHRIRFTSSSSYYFYRPCHIQFHAFCLSFPFFLSSFHFFSFPFFRTSLYCTRPSRLQRSRVENRVGRKYIVNPRILFLFSREEEIYFKSKEAWLVSKLLSPSRPIIGVRILLSLILARNVLFEWQWCM